MVVVIDPGHGGSDPGAVYNGRQEKDDVLMLAKEVGRILEARGIEVVYTRNNDIYETPFKKAQDANNANADYFISFHRNSSEYPNQYSGAEVLVYDESGIKSVLANNILDGMEAAGYKNLGVDERKDLVVLRRTRMPAVLIEAGFINNEEDNQIFDENFDRLAQGIADGVLNTLGFASGADNMAMQYEQNDPSDGENIRYNNGQCNCPNVLYRVQVGAFRNRDSADRMLNSLLIEEFPAFIVYDDGLYKVQVGAYEILDNAIRMERRMREAGYNTFIVSGCQGFV